MVLLRMLLAAAWVASSSAAVADDYLIKSMPGFEGTVPFKQYAGYMPLGDAGGTEMFFWFVESAGKPENDPVAFWTNGGPGSSSIYYGFWTEHGPFRLKRSATGEVVPELYEQSWNRIASVIYLEMPSGVGFSHSQDASLYGNITDELATEQSYTFLVKFFEVFPQFKANDFYLTGESYGGHYVPNLAEKFLDRPISGIDLKGFLIGNPGMESDWFFNVDEYAFVTFMWSHGLIPATEYLEAHKVCGWENFFVDCEGKFAEPTRECQEATGRAVNLIPQPLDFYNILAPTCHDYAQKAAKRKTRPFLKHMNSKYNLRFVGYEPCMAHLTGEYINRQDVRAAVHAVPSGRHWPDLPAGWSYDESAAGKGKKMWTIFPRFFNEAPQWKIWVISGDADGAVPLMATERWMHCLHRPVVKPWSKWLLNGEIGGMKREWDQMTLVTVKGCGHMVPMYCPEAGYEFWANYLASGAPAAASQEHLLIS